MRGKKWTPAGGRAPGAFEGPPAPKPVFYSPYACTVRRASLVPRSARSARALATFFQLTATKRPNLLWTGAALFPPRGGGGDQQARHCKTEHDPWTQPPPAGRTSGRERGISLKKKKNTNAGTISGTPAGATIQQTLSDRTLMRGQSEPMDPVLCRGPRLGFLEKVGEPVGLRKEVGVS